jgi:hypothetical protein
VNAPTPQEQFLPGLNLPTTETFADWQALGRRLCMGARAINWLIGDWLIDGAERFGDKARDEAQTIFRSDVDRFDPILKTCRRFPEPKRHAALTFGHHLAVMSIDDDTEAETLLSKAETERMTTAALKAEVKVIRSHARLPIEDDDPVDTAMRRIVQAWNLASREARQMFIELAQESHMGVIEL